jgi:DNA-directed RNA polymerase beta subunit
MTHDDILSRIHQLGEDTRENLMLKATIGDTIGKILESVEDPNIKLKVNKIWTVDKSNNDDIQAQMLTRNRSQSWSDDLRADLSLIDKVTGKEIDRAQNIKVSNVPKITPRNTFLVKGNEYQFTKQARLKPGVYTRIQDNGEISTFFNVDKSIDFERGFNNNFKINFDPHKKVFTMGYGAKNIPLINVLHAVGVAPNDMEKMWGKDVYESNQKAYGAKDAVGQRRMYEAIFGRPPANTETVETVAAAIKERLFATELDPETTRITLGKSYEKVDQGSLLTASKKILDVHRGEAQPDDRDSIVFKSFYGADDHIREKLIKNAEKLKSAMRFRLSKTRNINKSISSQTFDPFVLGTITTSTLSNPPGQTNLLSIMGENSKVTVMGEGGIATTNQISDDARQISNSEAGFIDPLHTPEGGQIGVSVHHTMRAIKLGNDLYSQFYDKTGKLRFMKPMDLHGKTIAFPDEYTFDGKVPKQKDDSIRAIKDGKITTVKPDEVDFIIRDHTGMFDTSTNLIPFLDSLQGNRGLTAAKMKEQALPLKYRDKPLWRIVDANGKNLNKDLGGIIAIPKAPVDGIVSKVTDSEIVVADAKGTKHTLQLYNNFPLNAESFIHNESKVKMGDRVKRGDILADNNNTRDGEFAIGANLRVAYVPWKGYNYEDSTVVSESAAKKLTSEHLYGFNAKRSSKGIFSRDKFKAYYPEEIDTKKASKLDKDGVIKVGEAVEHGDLLITHMEKRAPTADDLALGRLDKQMKKDFANNAVKWDKDHKGIVTSVEKHGNSVTVNIKTEEALKVADKISGLHGNKHIVSKILPDHEMPVTEDGKIIDITMSPIGVSNRINTSQILEAAAGKVAEKTGEQYEILNFREGDNSQRLIDDMKKAGVAEKDFLVDPETGRKTKNPVMTGVAHILKLEHKVDHKFNARYREGYDSNEQPLTGGETGGKNIGRMELGALLARGAKENLKEMFNIKGQRNDEFWKALEMGHMLPPPKTPHVWKKMEAMMKGAGINVEQEGKTFTVKPMTDKHIEALSAGELEDPTLTYRKKDLAPMRGGLFDPIKTGGLQGDNYTHFKLPEPVLNPIMARAAATILDMPETHLEAVVNGDKFIDAGGNMVARGTPGSFSGSIAVQQMLKKVDVDASLKDATKRAEEAKNPTELNKFHRKIRYLKQLKQNDMKPEDYIINKVLVVPPKFRPMFTMGTEGTVIMSDVNDLYQQVGMTAETMKDLKSAVKEVGGGNKDLEHTMMAQVRGALYKDMQALAGLREPTSYLHRIKDKKGFVAQIDGGKKQTKEGFYQDKVISRRQDLVGRSTVILNPELGGDQIGIPKAMASKVFQPFIMKEIVGLGYTPLEAQKHIKDETETFHKARQIVADKRLVIANRAPTLHRWNMTSFRPVLTDGKAIEMPATVISKFFGGDFDGDAFQIHVPVGQKAMDEAEKMLPSSDLLKTGYGTTLAAPDMDSTVGAWLISKGKGGEDKGKFGSLEEARNAYKSHKIDHSDTVEISGIKAPYGMHEINSVVPEDMRKYDVELKGGTIKKWIEEVTKKHNGKLALQLADRIKDVGNDYSTAYGFTLGVSDTAAAKDVRDPIIKSLKGMKSFTPEFMVDTVNGKMSKQINKELTEKYDENTMVGLPLHSEGGKGIGNMSQIVSAPLVMQDANKQVILNPVLHSYSEGLKTGEYWAAAHGARSGNIQKSVASYMPGWFTSDLVNSIYTTRIYGENPVDDEGIEQSIEDGKNLMNRYLAREVKDSKGRVIAKRNEIVNSDVVNRLNHAGIKTVHVQSPLTDPTPGDGISSYSYGVDYKGNRYKTGDNIGVISAHTITEPSLNMAMKAFHTGGAFSKSGTAFDVLDRLMRFGKNIPDKATMAEIGGKVMKIVPSSIGGHDVHIQEADGNEHVHYVMTGNDVKVKAGQAVSQGDVISGGTVSLHDVMKHKGIREAQKFLVNEVSAINDHKLDRRDIEVLVRGITNTTRIKKAYGVPYVPGDVAPMSTIENYNRNRIREVDIEDAENTRLNRDYDLFRKGSIVTDTVVKRLQQKGIKRIEVEAPPIVHEPFLSSQGIGSKAAVNEDWIARMSHNRLEGMMQEAVAQGWKSNVISGEHPLPALATGVQ